MTSREEGCAEHARFMAIDAAFRAGDLAALRAAVEDPAVVPNGPMPLGHRPLPRVRDLSRSTGVHPRPPRDRGQPNPETHAGFPPLIAAPSCSRPRPGAPGRPDVVEIIDLLLAFGADPDQRGINDYTALHMAVIEQNAAAVRRLLEAGADPRLRTRIDDLESPREIAEHMAQRDIVALLAAREALLAPTSRPTP